MDTIAIVPSVRSYLGLIARGYRHDYLVDTKQDCSLLRQILTQY